LFGGLGELDCCGADLSCGMVVDSASAATELWSEVGLLDDMKMPALWLPARGIVVVWTSPRRHLRRLAGVCSW
jgi:hypothetical protein